MITHIWFYSLLPALTALYCLLLLKRIWASHGSIAYIKLFSNLMVMNTLQAVAYLLFAVSPPLAEYVADAYLISLYYLFAHLMILAVSLSEKGANTLVVRCIYVFPLLLTALHLFGYMVESYRVEKNSLMHNDGEFAGLFDLFVIVSSVMTAVIFRYNIKHIRDDQMLASRNMIALISFIPLTLIFCVLIVLSMTENSVPVVIVVPLISIYILLVFYYISRSRIVDLSIGPNFFIKRIKLAWILLESLRTKGDIKRFQHQLEKQIIQEALKEHNNAIQATADSLKMNHTTLRNKIKEYNLVTQ